MSASHRRSRRFVVCVAAFLLAPIHAKAEQVALTFDDLLTLALGGGLPYAQATTSALLSGLKRDGVPATGFVNESKLAGPEGLEQTALLRRWLDAGADLGNHTYSHLSLNKTPVATYIADTARGEITTKALLAERGRRPRWFRYPYLETGLTAQDRSVFEGWLSAYGYRVAPVTMENSDWMFAYPYDEAVLKQDKASAARIRGEYLAYTIAAVGWYRTAALQLLGRRPAFVFLLHASRLNADSIDALGDLEKRRAERRLPGQRHGRSGLPHPRHLCRPRRRRVAEPLVLRPEKALPWESFPQPPADIAAAEDRLDTAP